MDTQHLLNYWNAIILHDFKAIAPKDAATSGMDGSLIIGSNLAIDNYYINSKGNIHCHSNYKESIPLAEYGLNMNNKADHSTAHQRYQIRDAIVSGSIQLYGDNKAESNAHVSFHDGMVRPMQSCRLLVNRSPYQENIPSISAYENIAKKDITVPVTRNSTFQLDISQAFTSQLPTCNTVWNFFTVDEQGIMDDSEEQSFTVNRVFDTMIGGTFLFPFGNVVDGPSGGFAGQLIAFNYESKRASLYGFEAINASCHTTSASCWPHLRRDDAMSTETEPEQEDDLEWMIRRGRQLLPVAISDQEDQSPSKQDEISKALASTTTVTEIVLPSEAVLGSSVSSM